MKRNEKIFIEKKLLKAGKNFFYFVAKIIDLVKFSSTGKFDLQDP